MMFEVNYETKEDLYRRVVMECGIPNLVKAYWDMLDEITKDENGKTPEYDNLDNELMWGDGDPMAIAVLSVTGERFYGGETVPLTLNQIEKVALIASKIDVLSTGRINKS